MILQDLYKYLYGSSPVDCLQMARQLHNQYGEDLQSNKPIMKFVEELRGATRELNTQMAMMDMGRICSDCGAGDSGGCCSLYMAGECDTLQILMNLLVDIDVEVVQDNGPDCCFLGPSGCIFIFKPMFCLNYNCSRIRNTTGKKLMQQLENRSGIQLAAQYGLEKHLLAYFVHRL